MGSYIQHQWLIQGHDHTHDIYCTYNMYLVLIIFVSTGPWTSPSGVLQAETEVIMSADDTRVPETLMASTVLYTKTVLLC